MIRSTPGIFQRVSNHYSDAQRPALKLKVDNSSILSNCKATVPGKPPSIMHIFMKYFFLNCGEDSPPVSLVYIFLNLVKDVIRNLYIKKDVIYPRQLQRASNSCSF